MTPDEFHLAQAKAMPEEELQENVRQLAVTFGWLFYHTRDSRHSPAGFPDCVMVRGDRLIFAELKRHGKNPTPTQQEWLDRLGVVVTHERYYACASPVEAYVWRPLDRLDGTILRILT